MSLETALQETTTAINALVQLLTTRTAPTMSAAEYIATLDTPAIVAAQVDITAAPVAPTVIETLDPTTGKITKHTPEQYAAVVTKNAAKVESPKSSPIAIVEPAPVVVTSTAASPSEPAAELDYSKDVKPLLLDLSKAKGRDALAELLAMFDATNGTQIAATAYADVIARVQSLLAA